MERAPVVLPAQLHRLAAGVTKRSTKPLLANGVRVGRKHDCIGGLGLLEPVREELEQRRAGRFGCLRGYRDGDASELAAQRNALFSFSKNPSSAR